ncbi:MAG: hypothetical protein H0Z33_10485 [Bacillaceae bacterium]|nr:hypothetical protein [Bacillaceae bacterium]
MDMDVYALYGPSGTGKSSIALQVAYEYEIPAIIDDGLLIYNGRKIAGSSAKYEKTRIQAVKRAIFIDPQHAEEIKKALRENQITRLLILGTSRKMIRRITESLELPSVTEYISITDVRDTGDIKAALYSRETEGKHVIPIPRIQVERHLLRRLMDSVENILTGKNGDANPVGERTIVMPRFHRGRILIHENTLKKIVLYACRDLTPYVRFQKIKVETGSSPYAQLHIGIIHEKETSLLKQAEQIQQRVFDTIDQHLNLEIRDIRISIDKIFPKT